MFDENLKKKCAIQVNGSEIWVVENTNLQHVNGSDAKIQLCTRSEICMVKNTSMQHMWMVVKSSLGAILRQSEISNGISEIGHNWWFDYNFPFSWTYVVIASVRPCVVHGRELHDALETSFKFQFWPNLVSMSCRTSSNISHIGQYGP